MNRLQVFAALTEEHFAVRAAVRELEEAWGPPPSAAAIGELAGIEEAQVCRLLRDLHDVGYVEWRPQQQVAWLCRGTPLLGEVR